MVLVWVWICFCWDEGEEGDVGFGFGFGFGLGEEEEKKGDQGVYVCDTSNGKKEAAVEVEGCPPPQKGKTHLFLFIEITLLQRKIDTQRSRTALMHSLSFNRLPSRGGSLLRNPKSAEHGMNEASVVKVVAR